MDNVHGQGARHEANFLGTQGNLHIVNMLCRFVQRRHACSRVAPMTHYCRDDTLSITLQENRFAASKQEGRMIVPFPHFVQAQQDLVERYVCPTGFEVPMCVPCLVCFMGCLAKALPNRRSCFVDFANVRFAYQFTPCIGAYEYTVLPGKRCML
jgi:hypothetical protein